jgi:broad specificity phosphatase PhoE
LATHSKYGYGRKILSVSILPEGIPAIKRIADELKNVPNSLQRTSEFVRCKETCSIITQVTGKTFEGDLRLNEKYHEKIYDVRMRVMDFLDEIMHLPQQNIIICTHGAIISAIKNLLLHKKFVTKHLHDFPPTGTLMIIKEGDIEIKNFN